MSKRKKSSNSSRLPLVLFFLGVAVVAGLAVYIKSTGMDRIPPSLVRQDRNPEAPGPKTVFIYDPERAWSPVEVTVPEGQGPAKTAINAFLAQTKSDLKLLSADVRGDHAVLNFSGAFSGMGSMEESTMADAILRILGQFPNVKTAEFLANGETMESGHQVYDKVNVIRPGEQGPPEVEGN
jgi:hypothetical protein